MLNLVQTTLPFAFLDGLTCAAHGSVSLSADDGSTTMLVSVGVAVCEAQ